MRPLLILFLLTLGQIIMYADRGYVSGVLPLLQSALGSLSDSSLGILGSAFVIGYAVSCPLFAFASQSINTYKLIASGLALWCSAVLVCGMTDTFGTLSMARVLTGVGEASLLGLGPTCIDDIAPASQRTIWLSVFFSSLPLGGALGYVFGGIAVNLGLSWHQGFLVEFALMLPLLLIIWFIPNMTIQPFINNDKSMASPMTRHSITQKTNLLNRSYSQYVNDFARSSPVSRQHSPKQHQQQQQQAASITLTTASPVQSPSTKPLLQRTALTLGNEVQLPDSLTLAVEHDESASSAQSHHTTHSLQHQLSSPSQNHTHSTSLVTPSNAAIHTQRLLTRTSTFVQKHTPRSHSSQPIPPLLRDDVMLADNVKLLFTDAVYILLVLGYAALAFVTGALSFWAPVHFARMLHITLSDSTRAIGGITFVCGLLGTCAGGWMMDMLASGKRGKKLAIVQVALQLSCVFTGISILFATTSIFLTQAVWSLSCLGVAQFFIFGVGAPINAALLSIAPTTLRSLAMSVSILIMHLLGDLPSPFLFGVVSDLVAGDMRLAMALLCAWLSWSVVAWASASHICQRRLDKLKQQLRQKAQQLIDPHRTKHSTQQHQQLHKDVHVSYATFEQVTQVQQSPNHRL